LKSETVLFFIQTET